MTRIKNNNGDVNPQTFSNLKMNVVDGCNGKECRSLRKRKKNNSEKLFCKKTDFISSMDLSVIPYSERCI